MAQTGYTPISIYYSATSTNVPTAGNLVAGELAINTADGKLFYKDSAGVVQVIAGKGGAGVAGGSNTQVQYNSSGSLAGSANMTFSGTALTLANDASISGLTVGKGSGAISTNTTVGRTAGNTNTTGSENTFIGDRAGYTNATGIRNTVLGSQALYSAEANNNTAIGWASLNANTSGGSNTAVGQGSLQSNTTASGNTAVGYQSSYSNTTGDGVGIGYQALYSNTTGGSLTAVGYQALRANTTANHNSAFGDSALLSNTTGATNTAIGKDSLRSNTTASNNTAVGYQASYSSTTGTNNVAVGYQAGYSGDYGYYTLVGYQAGFSNTDASGGGVFVGWKAGYANTSGQSNTAIGVNCMGSNTTASNNVAVGAAALYANTTGSPNVAVGNQSLRFNTTGGANIAMGYQALYSNTTATNNTAVGYQAGYTLTSGATNNAFFGYQAGYSTITSGSNQFFGYEAGKNVTTGYYNTVLGAYNGNQGGLDIRTANNYIVLADGQGNPRGTFDASGNFLVGKFAPTSATVGCEMRPNGIMTCTRSSGPPLSVNRTTDDGDLVSFQQDGTQEGSISVSGTTVSYNGGHLSRWSQWQNQTGKPEVYRGSVLESTNDMCEWNQANEQATKTIVSTTAKSKAVAGVFDMYDLTDETNPYDFYVAQSGDFVIRIAQGVAVENGDLLESAGDGTARPQSDDICRSSTVAKVTSNYVSITYADGSYCVPCILMIG